MSGVIGGLFGGGGGDSGGMGNFSLGNLPDLNLPSIPGPDQTPSPTFVPVPKKQAKDGWLDVDPKRGQAGTIATGPLGRTDPVRKQTLVGSDTRTLLTGLGRAADQGAKLFGSSKGTAPASFDSMLRSGLPELGPSF